MTSRRAFIGFAIAGAIAAPRAIGAQARKVARIGVLSPFAASDGPAPSFQVFRDTLRELGHAEGDTVSFTWCASGSRALRTSSRCSNRSGGSGSTGSS